MNTYQRGTAINIVQRFWTIDPITEVATLADPTGVTFEILSPDNVETTYTFGTDGNVTNPSVGVYVCALDPQLPVGTYRYRSDGTGAVEASSEDYFDVIESGVLTPAPPTVAVTGPCSSWINGEDVALAGPAIPGIGDNTWLLDDVAYNASYILYEASGRQFPGVCTRTVRPCQDGCGCFGASRSTGLGLWAWASSYGSSVWGWGWYNECGDRCGCGELSSIRLAGYPVREILEVKIGGDVLDATTDGHPNYRLDARSRLVRMDTPGDPPTANRWPSCQNLSLDDDQPGTFSVKYTWGADVPALGRAAAAALARELWIAGSGGECSLPSKVTRIVRAGVEIDRLLTFASEFRSGSTGIVLVDAFISTVNPGGMRRRPAVYSPDLQQYARKVGQ